MDFFSYTSLALISSVMGAIATILARTLLKDLKARDIMGVNFLVMGATLLLFSPLFYKFEASWLSMALVFLIAGIDTLANFLYFKTLEKMEASAAAPVLSLAPGFAFLCSWVFLSETIDLKTISICIAIIALVVFFSTDKFQFSRKTMIPLLLPLFSSLLFGLSSIPAKYLLSDLHSINSPTLYMIRAGFIGLFSLLLFKFRFEGISQKQFRFIFFRGLIVITQFLLLYYALAAGSTGVTITLANLNPIFVFLLGMVFLQEKWSLKKLVACALVLGLSLSL